MNYANLIFKDGRQLQVAVRTEQWPETIDHKYALISGAPTERTITDQTIRFYYYGTQSGIAAYVEKSP